MNFRILPLFILLSVIDLNAIAQKSQSFTNAQATRKPLWIPMLEDTTANYFNVERAFNTYFAHHELPEEEHDIIGEHAEREKHFSRRRLRRMAKEDALRMDVRRYYNWHEQMLPYVQADGRILSPTQRLAIWREQQQTQR